jgi:hypothetical protein
MNCAELESLLCDYVDGTLKPAERERVERHLAQCAACSGLVRDASAAVSFLAQTPEVEPPKELVTRLMFQAASAAKHAGGLRSGRLAWWEPVLQPRFAMGMAMTILSFAMLGRFVNIPIRQLQPRDLNPVEIWAALDDRVHRAWERGVKYYESVRLFVEIKSQLRELAAQDEDSPAPPAGALETSGNSPLAPAGGTGAPKDTSGRKQP